MYTFIVTNMDSAPEKLIPFYCKRGKMENYIKESKNGFDFSAVSSRSKLVNANRLQLHALAYNLFNWFKRLVLPVQMRKQTVDTIRMRLLKLRQEPCILLGMLHLSFAAAAHIKQNSMRHSNVSNS